MLGAQHEHEDRAPCRNGRAIAARALAIIIVTLLWLQPAAAQQQAATLSPQPSPEARFDLLKFLAGGALGLASHEGGHVVFDLAFNAHPRLKRVSLGWVPFFAIVHRGDLSPRCEWPGPGVD